MVTELGSISAIAAVGVSIGVNAVGSTVGSRDATGIGRSGVANISRPVPNSGTLTPNANNDQRPRLFGGATTSCSRGECHRSAASPNTRRENAGYCNF